MIFLVERLSVLSSIFSRFMRRGHSNDVLQREWNILVGQECCVHSMKRKVFLSDAVEHAMMEHENFKISHKVRRVTIARRKLSEIGIIKSVNNIEEILKAALRFGYGEIEPEEVVEFVAIHPNCGLTHGKNLPFAMKPMSGFEFEGFGDLRLIFSLCGAGKLSSNYADSTYDPEDEFLFKILNAP